MEILSESFNKKSDEPTPKFIVKLRTTMWGDRRGIYLKKSITFLKRQSVDIYFLEDDIEGMGADEVLIRILNLNECDDGIYELVVCNVSHDWETGYVDDYDYRLKPIDKKKDQV